MDKEWIVVLYEGKIKKLLERFLQPDFEIKADTYLNLLLSHISSKEDKDLGDTLINLPVFTEWLFECIKLWEDGKPLPSANIITFVFHIASLLSSKEAHFDSFSSRNFYTRLCTVVKEKGADLSPSVQLSHITLLRSILEHELGQNWLFKTNNWMEILTFCLTGQTIYIVREGQNFMYQLLLAASNCNESCCNKIIEKLMLIFQQTQHSSASLTLEVNGDNLHEKLTPSLKLIAFILESCLQSDSFAAQNYTLPQMFVRHLELQQNFWNNILTGIKNQDLVYELSRVMILYNIFKVAIECNTRQYKDKQNQQMITFIVHLFKQLILKYDTLNILKIGYISQYYWSSIMPRLENVLQNRDKLPIVFDVQVMMFQVLPILAVSYKYCDFNMEAACDICSSRDAHITKIYSSMSEETIRWAYNFRKRLEDDPKNIFQNAQRSFMYIMKGRSYMQREPAILAFQYFVYILKDANRVMNERPETIDLFIKNAGYLVTHLDAIAVFIQEYDITWRESIETTSIMCIIMTFINLTHWPPRLIVQILKLIRLCIARFTTPSLALLVDGTCNSALANLGALLTTKLLDTSWEVKDSALEVLQTICGVAHTKFPSFQSLIVEHDLPTLVITVSLYDSEGFVRASGLKCLKEMVQVPEVWKAVLILQELPEKILEVLYNETEAIVRFEATSVVCTMYEHNLLGSQLIDSIDQVMAHAVVSDLHWEVKLQALCYWNKVIENQLSHQGMIDGEFPEVTFSSEHKKIVTLTNDEIRNRLKKVLTQLSQCGCLGVLVAAVQDDCDIEVSKKALEVIKRLSTLLGRYNVTFASMDMVTCQRDVANNIPFITTHVPTVEVADNVIDEIVNTRDIQLLPHVYQESDSNCSLTRQAVPGNTQFVTPQDFLNFVNTDLDILVDQRKTWLNDMNDLGSLLDDMLKNYDISDDTNAMDCY